MIRTLTATRYVTPLREGGSLPAVVEADDNNLYVVKFVGAGQGPKALIAELLAGEIGRALGLNVPEIVFIDLDPAIGRSESDPEIQDLLRASIGLNLGLAYLPNALEFNILRSPPPDAELASKVVWFDSYVTNVDRTPRNVNMLLWHQELWLIDHGAALYFHHDWNDYLSRSQSPFKMIKDHTLIPLASQIQQVDAAMQALLRAEVIEHIVQLIPNPWLTDEFATSAEHRRAYATYLLTRLNAAPHFVEEAAHVHRRSL